MKTHQDYAERDLVSTDCNTCGSNYHTFYDKFYDEYICKDCLDREEDTPEEEEDEDEEEEEYHETQEQQRNEQREADFKRRDRE